MTHYDKLVRDRIPEIITASGRKPEVRVLSEGEYLDRLTRKLGEEMQEYLASGSVEELADLAEVILALAQLKGVSPDQFEQIRQAKRAERGGFEQRLLLISVGE